MARARRIIVRGKPRTNIDATALAQVLLAIAADWEHGPETETIASPDVFDAAIEDRQVEPRPRRHRA